MKKKISYIRFLKLWWLVLLLVLGVFIITIDVIDVYHDSSVRIDKIRNDYIAYQKADIKREVTHFIDTIAITRSKQLQSTKDIIKSRVSEAYSIVQNIYDENKGDKSESEIKKMILDTLRPIRYADGNGFYGIHSLEGEGILCNYNPAMEGENLQGMQDSCGRYIVKEMSDAVRRPAGGFCEFSWDKPDVDGGNHKKILYFKLFKPYGWIIGTGLYLEDVESQVKAQFLEQVNSARFGENGYFYVTDRYGVILAHGMQPKLIGKDMRKVAGSLGVEVVNRFVEIASVGDGYLEYQWVNPSTTRECSKIAYIASVQDWGYYLATGVYLDDIEPVIATQLELLNREIIERLVVFITLIAVVIVLFILFVNRFNVRLEQDLSQFMRFFKRSVDSDEKIDRDPIRFTEFDQMAQSANEMLEARIEAGRALQDEKEQLSCGAGS